MREWIPEAIKQFKAVMPSIDVPFPQIYIVSDKNAGVKRQELVEALDSPLVNRVGKSYMELIHGNKGDAILIYQNSFNGRIWEINAQEIFCHFLWHEHGHFFAIYNENHDENFFRFMDQQPHPDEYYALLGYVFWSEFIAEVIACKVTPAPLIDWRKERWRDIRNCLTYNLVGAFQGGKTEVDHYDLAHYYARLLADKKVISFLEAFNNGTIKVNRYSESYSGNESDMIPLKDTNTDPEGLEEILNKNLLPLMKDFKEYLTIIINKDNYWAIDYEDLDTFGLIINKMNQYMKAEEFEYTLRDRIFR